MPVIDLDLLNIYRARTYNLLPRNRVASPAQALDFVNRRGFIFFWPVKNMDLPSLWTSVAGDRPVPNEHDDPGHKTWGWKDDSLGKRIWYYGKVLRRKATFISLEVAPYFYALSRNYGSPEDDYLIDYHSGRLTQAAKQVYEALLAKGALDTIALRKEARLLNARESEFARAMEDLQSDFKVLPVGIAEVGAWRYAYRYDLTARHFPALVEQARLIQEAEARDKLTELYFRSVGVGRILDLKKLFGWPPDLVRRTLPRFLQNGELVDVKHPQVQGEWLALSELVA